MEIIFKFFEIFWNFWKLLEILWWRKMRKGTQKRALFWVFSKQVILGYFKNTGLSGTCFQNNLIIFNYFRFFTKFWWFFVKFWSISTFFHFFQFCSFCSFLIKKHHFLWWNAFFWRPSRGGGSIPYSWTCIFDPPKMGVIFGVNFWTTFWSIRGPFLDHFCPALKGLSEAHRQRLGI